ncbi:MAG: hypothetical protein IPH11_13315 [Ignavibacteriales bacterium]|nr:hypothetical protein [Ignavibacteriales bacterium]
MIILKTKGTFNSDGKIVLDSIRTIHWKELSDGNPPQLPAGSSIELSISFDENDFLSGKEGIVWATYDLRQAEIIQSTLLAQHINCEVKKIALQDQNLFLISITNEREIKVVVDFIWKSDSGLRLKPDWSYPKDVANKSFEQWLNEH